MDPQESITHAANQEEVSVPQSIQEQLDAQQRALTKIYQSVEQTRKYILWTTIGTLITFVLPLIAMVFILPRFIHTYTDTLGSFM